jgi:sodium/bile acid cotransporter 7
MASESSKRCTCCTRSETEAFVIKHYLPLAFLVAITIALCWPEPGTTCLNVKVGNVHIIPELLIMVVFFISGGSLNTQDLNKAKGFKGAILFGVVSILLISPLLGFATRAIPLNPEAFSTGLTVWTAMPTTLGVGIALVRSCKGNEGNLLLLASRFCFL